jgi:uncharacterized protein
MDMLRAVNKKSGTLVAGNVEHARGHWSRFWGLMGRRSLPEGRGMLIEPCNSVHTMFMRFPIDVVFLDGEDRVLKISRDMKPFRFAVGRGSRRVLEVPAGWCERVGLDEGDQLEIVAAAETPGLSG